MAVKQTAEGAQKMTFDAARVAAGSSYVELLKKYRVDVKENMISEWSKIQQLCEEVDGSAALTAAAGTLGVAAAIARLKTIADDIRTKITQRSSELPDAQQMKKARLAMDPEYKALIQILNATAILYGKGGSFDNIIKTLNDNINYVKIHAMSKTSDTDGGSDDGGSDDGGSDDGGDDGGSDTPTPTPSGGGDEQSLDKD